MPQWTLSKILGTLERGGFILLFTPISSSCSCCVQCGEHPPTPASCSVTLFYSPSTQKENSYLFNNCHQRKLTHTHWLSGKVQSHIREHAGAHSHKLQLCLYPWSWWLSVTSTNLLPVSGNVDPPSCSSHSFFLISCQPYLCLLLILNSLITSLVPWYCWHLPSGPHLPHKAFSQWQFLPWEKLLMLDVKIASFLYFHIGHLRCLLDCWIHTRHEKTDVNCQCVDLPGLVYWWVGRGGCNEDRHGGIKGEDCKELYSLIIFPAILKVGGGRSWVGMYSVGMGIGIFSFLHKLAQNIYFVATAWYMWFVLGIKSQKNLIFY